MTGHLAEGTGLRRMNLLTSDRVVTASPCRSQPWRPARPALERSPLDQSSMFAETFPPFAAIGFITCLCSQVFMLALSFMSPQGPS